MKRLFGILLLLAVPGTALGGTPHPYLKPEREMAISELGVPAPVHPGPIPVYDYLPEYPEQARPAKKPNAIKRMWKKIPKRDRDLLPGYLYLAAGNTADLYSTHEAIRLGNGQIVEGNVVLVRADEIAERLNLPSGTGRDVVSSAITATYAVYVRNYVYPKSPRWAKVALYAAGTFRFGLFFWNRRNVRLVRVP
jgi:hypothetical protein